MFVNDESRWTSDSSWERGIGPGEEGLMGLGKTAGLYIELGSDRRVVHWDWAWTSTGPALMTKWQTEKLLPIINRCRIKVKIRSRIRVKSTLPLISGWGKEFHQMFVVQYLGCSRSWTSSSSSADPEWILGEGKGGQSLAVAGVSLLQRVQTGLKRGGIPDSDLTGDSG